MINLIVYLGITKLLNAFTTQILKKFEFILVKKYVYQKRVIFKVNKHHVFQLLMLENALHVMNNKERLRMGKLFDVAISYAMENEEIAETVYHYLKAKELSVFYAPAPECQSILSGKNQREIFYRIFGLESRYVILLVSKFYITKQVPMEEARIAFSRHSDGEYVIPIYLDGTELPRELLDPKKQNYFSSDNASEIAFHVISKVNKSKNQKAEKDKSVSCSNMKNKKNKAGTQIFIQNYNG